VANTSNNANYNELIN